MKSSAAMTTLRARGGWPALVLGLLVSGAEIPPAFAARLGVDDPDPTGSLGDARLSLSEAILLAGGQLSPLALSAGERARVGGDPGAGTADLIRVELGKRAVLTTSAGLPPLIGNEGDVLDGGGATLQGTGGGVGLLSSSSHIHIRGFAFVGYSQAVVVSPAPGAADLEDVRISQNRFSDYQSGVVVAPNPRGSKGLRGLSIDANRFVAGTSSGNAILVLGASPAAPGEVATDYVVENVAISNNQISGGFEGIAVFGGMSLPGTSVRNGLLRGVRISGNTVRDVYDVSIAVYGGFANGGGDVSGVELSDVEIAGNRIVSSGTPSTHIWVVAGAAVFEPGGLVEANLIRDVDVLRNATSGAGSCTGGIQLQASQNELGGGTVRANRLEEVRVVGNSVSMCENGIGVFSGLAAAGHGLVEGNEIQGVLVSENRLKDNPQGVNVISGLGLEGSALPLPGSQPALIQGNLVEAVSVVRNRIKGGLQGIVAIGGISNVTSDVVASNVISGASASGNSVRGAQFVCRVFDDVVLGNAGGAATGNRADFACQ